MTLRIWLAAALMGLSVLAAGAMAPDRLATGNESVDLDAMIPEAIGAWRLEETMQPVLPREEDEEDENSLAARIYDRTLVRTYRNADGEHVMLVVAYGRDQSDALQLHLPEVCYAAQGFAVEEKRHTSLDFGNGIAVPAVRVMTRRGPRSEPVTYWARIGDSVAPSMLARQWAKLTYGIRGRVPDGVLIRVSTISGRPRHAFETQERFLREMVHSVAPAHRPFFIGRRAQRANLAQP